MGEVINTNPEYWLRKRSGRKTGFPLGTIAYYGPDNLSASKLVVGVFLTSQLDEPELKKWFQDDSDIRQNRVVLEEMVEFLQRHNVERVAMIDAIIGCPHEEDIDYPEGEWCPQCPYWKDRDRFDPSGR